MSDVILIPVSTVRPDLVTETGTVVYVPLASKESHGIVKIGDGLNITKSGVLSVDSTILDDVSTVKNSVDVISNNLSDLSDVVVLHINDFDNPHRVTKEQVGLGNVDNTSDINKPISTATQKELDRIESRISNSDNVESFDNYSTMVDNLNKADSNKYSVGQSIYIRTLDVPDVWIYDVKDVPVEYVYTDDAVISDTLNTTGTIQIGYYVIAALETGKIDLGEYVTLDTKQTISGDKNFTGDLRINGVDVVTVTDINGVTLESLNFQPIDGKIMYANNKVYYQGEFSYTTKNSSVPVAIDGTIVLPIIGDGVTISSDNNTLIIKAEIPEIDTSNLVTLDGYETITGVKTFTEQIGILNGSDGDINYIKHINNNFLISSSDGDNIINIDEQLKVFNFYNKPLALEEYVDTNFISYNVSQTLTDEQKEIARNNIGAGTGGGTASGVYLVWWED